MSEVWLEVQRRHLARISKLELELLRQQDKVRELKAENKVLRELWLEWDSIDEKKIDSWEAKMRALLQPPKENSSDEQLGIMPVN